MKTNWGGKLRLNTSTTSALDGGEESASRPVRFMPGERTTSTHWLGGWMDPRTVDGNRQIIRFTQSQTKVKIKKKSF